MLHCRIHKRPLTCVSHCYSSRVSSVSIVSGYGLDDRAIEVRFPAGTKDFSSILCVQTGSGAYPVSCTMGTGGPFSRVKRGRGVTLTTHPHLVPMSWMSNSYTSSLPFASMACSGTALLYFLHFHIATHAEDSNLQGISDVSENKLSHRQHELLHSVTGLLDTLQSDKIWTKYNVQLSVW
jgi:hypothetical protein